MKELTKVFDGNELRVDMINDKEFYIDVTGIARKYGKDFRDWSNSKRVSDTIKKWEKSQSLSVTEMIIKTGNARKIHNKLLMSFARWISIDFEIFADNMVYDIITGNLADKYQCEMQEALTKSRQCNVYVQGENKFTSCRGLLQNVPELASKYDEKSIKDLLFAKGLIEPVYKQVKTWRVTDKGRKTDLFNLDSHGTILYNIDNTTKAINQLVIAESIRENSQIKKISVYNGFTGDFYCQFDSLSEAERQLGVTGISGVLNGKRQKKHIRGMVFRDDEPKDKIEPLSGDDLKKIFRDINVFKNGIFIKRCKTLKEAGSIGGNGTTQVKRLIDSGKANQSGYTYAYANLEFSRR